MSGLEVATEHCPTTERERLRKGGGEEFLRSIGVPDQSPEEITERARRWPTTT
jgi:hypothetical protein